MSVYSIRPQRFLERLVYRETEAIAESICCAGFELSAWRCTPFAAHLIEWLPEYALPEDELNVTHANMYVKLQQAAVRVYTSEKYALRGEAGEIALHAICREYFNTIPISPRVFYKSASNDVVKAFDLVHAHLPQDGDVEIWLGESKLYQDSEGAVTDAIRSVSSHLEKGFLEKQKVLLGPQIPKSTPRRGELLELFAPQTSLDKFTNAAVFVIGILSNSAACRSATQISTDYTNQLEQELNAISERLRKSGLTSRVRLSLIYLPLADKARFVSEFDQKLKGLQ